MLVYRMIIQYFSDIHLEFIEKSKLEEFLENIKASPNAVCICAGDIGNPLHSNNHYDRFMKHVSKCFKKVFVIAGNHEYYQSTALISEVNAYLSDYFTQYSNISFLNNTVELYEDYTFIGTTLWSHIANPEYAINDVRNIPNCDTIQYNQLNARCVDFLKTALKTNTNCIVITHHMPSESLIDSKYKTHTFAPYNQWFYCNMDSVIDMYKTKIKCWIYGHTHTPSTTEINNIPFICNPIGYPNENSSIDFNKTLSL